MVLKKKTFSEDEIIVFDDAVIYKRGDYWQFRMWLAKERKYARFSLKTRNQSTAIDKAKLHYHELMANQLQGKSYFSLTTKDGVELFLKQRWKHCEAGQIVKGRYATIRTHLDHWLDFIKRDTKLRELERTDCEDYSIARTKTKKGISVSQSTVQNEQSTINSMMSWLFKRHETYIDSFDFMKLSRKDRGSESQRRSIFTDDEIGEITLQLENYITERVANANDQNNLTQIVCAYHLLIAIITGMRRGEQLQLRWSDVDWMERCVNGTDYSLIKIHVRKETSKVRKERTFIVKDLEYFDNLFKLMYPRLKDKMNFGTALIFSTNGETPISIRAIDYLFDKILNLSGIRNRDSRDLVPYSFRHTFITQRINSGLPPVAVAEICGTSSIQIQNTYYHTTEEKMVSNAMADYVRKDGLLIPKVF